MEIVSEATAHWMKCRHDEATEALRMQENTREQQKDYGQWKSRSTVELLPIMIFANAVGQIQGIYSRNNIGDDANATWVPQDLT